MQASIYNIEPFDARFGTIIKFNWTGNQVSGNRCIIVDSDTMDFANPIYDQYVDSMRLEHEVDPSKVETRKSLINGKRYLAYITVFDLYGNESDLQSIGKQFLCLETPVFKFRDISSDGSTIIDSSSYELILEYSQADGELLDSWQISIYDTTNTLLTTSGVTYDTSNLGHRFSGFTSATKYKARGIGTTVNGMSLDTGYVEFSAYYDMAAVFSMLELTNLPKTGAILIHSNIISADGKAEHEPVSYINGTSVDLTNNLVRYNEGFIMDDDFSIVFYAYRITPNVPFFKFATTDTQNFQGIVTYRVGNIGSSEKVGQLELRINTGGIASTVIYSKTIPAISENSILGFCLVRQNGLYDIQIVDLGEVA